MFPRLYSQKRKHYANWAITVRTILSIKFPPPSQERLSPLKSYFLSRQRIKENPRNTVYMFRQQRDLLYLSRAAWSIFISYQMPFI